jgi:hypothetical protein
MSIKQEIDKEVAIHREREVNFASVRPNVGSVLLDTHVLSSKCAVWTERCVEGKSVGLLYPLMVDVGKCCGLVFGGLGASNYGRDSVFKIVGSEELEIKLTFIVNHEVKRASLIMSVLESCLLAGGHLFERQKKKTEC